MINDRREDADRRGRGPRRNRASPPEDGPPPPERRERQRRLVEDRRFSRTPFAAEDAERITSVLLRTGTLVRCPQCNHELTMSPPIATADGRHREVRCVTCWRSVAVENAP